MTVGHSSLNYTNILCNKGIISQNHQHSKQRDFGTDLPKEFNISMVYLLSMIMDRQISKFLSTYDTTIHSTSIFAPITCLVFHCKVRW